MHYRMKSSLSCEFRVVRPPAMDMIRMFDSTSMSKQKRVLCLLLCLLSATVLLSPRALAQRNIFPNATSSEWVMTDGKQQTGGMDITIRCSDWIGDRPGYLPIKVVAKSWPAPVFTSNGTLEVHIGALPGSMYGGVTHAIVTIPIEANTSVASGEMLVNFLDDTYYIGIACYRDGRYLSGQSGNIYMQSAFGNASREDSQAVIVLSDKPEKLDSSSAGYLKQLRARELYFFNDPNIAQQSVGRLRGVYCDPKRLPQNWLYFSNAKIVALDLETLVALPESDQRTLKTYAMAGGELAVTGVTSFEALQSALDLDLSRDISDQPSTERKDNIKQQPWLITDAMDRSVDRPRIFQYGLGMVRSLPHGIEEYHHGSQAFDSEYSQRYGLVRRNGRFKTGVGDDYWEWLIPSVKKTPVLLFLGITLFFVGGIAPAVLIWSGRHRRRVWLIVLMPVIAIAVTSVLSLYAVVYDGFGTSLRSRSLTFVDRSGDGFVWSRQTYFSSSLPRDGVRVPDNTQVVPFSTRTLTEEPQVVQRHVDGQHVYEGLLPVRTSSQFFVSHPVSKVQVFELEPGSSNLSETPKLKNRMAHKWLGALFINDKGDCFVAEETMPGEPANFTMVNQDDAVDRLSIWSRHQLLAAPADAPSVDNESLSEIMNDIFGFYRIKSNGTGKVAEETIWQSCCGSLAVLRPNTFVVYTSQVDHLTKLIKAPAEADGVHVITGGW